LDKNGWLDLDENRWPDLNENDWPDLDENGWPGLSENIQIGIVVGKLGVYNNIILNKLLRFIISPHFVRKLSIGNFNTSEL